MIVLFLTSILYTSLSTLVFYRRSQLTLNFNFAILITLLCIIIAYTFYQPHNMLRSIPLIQFNKLGLVISLQLDTLTRIMMIYITTIGLLIYRYATNYLESDSTRMRFLAQFSLVLFSVVLLVMSENLLTAFIAWQLIGITLYLLLNHYHNDPAANRAAKKKFVINRIGDCCFLLAMVLSYHTQSAMNFAALKGSAHAEWICALLFISVMTKCAQFPFHMWLIDTMETPTPVSALMHAGVINAGGFLLVRISPAVIQYHALCYFILFIGLLSSFLSIQWMNQQPDTKKKLAYSTMGQMGYMLAQCSLGAFPAAIFHLISHGFYKASLFLNAGETLLQPTSVHSPQHSYLDILNALIISGVIFSLPYFIFYHQKIDIPVLILGFIYLTLTGVVLNIMSDTHIRQFNKLIFYFLLSFIYVIYIYIFRFFSRQLSSYSYHHTITFTLQMIILVLILTLQIYSWKASSRVVFSLLNDHTERFWRYTLLTPLRRLGNIINSSRASYNVFIAYLILFIITLLGGIYVFSYNALEGTSRLLQSEWFIGISLLIGIISLIIANRCLSIKALIIYLILFELAFSNIAFYDGDAEIIKLGLFHLINISLILFMLALIAKPSNVIKPMMQKTNRLPSRAFYLVFGLLLLIGIPGTASFITEFFILNALFNNSIIYIFMYVCLIILLSIVIMHSLQLYAFNKQYASLLTKALSKKQHIIFLTIIIINIVFGVFPNLLLRHI